MRGVLLDVHRIARHVRYGQKLRQLPYDAIFIFHPVAAHLPRNLSSRNARFGGRGLRNRRRRQCRKQ